MTTINNIQPLSAEALFDILKKEFTEYLNAALDANTDIDYSHVADIINLRFPEITEGIVFTLIVSEDSIQVSKTDSEADYNTDLLEEHLVQFLTLKAE